MFVLGVAAYLFFAPFYAELDSTRNLYRFRFHRVAYLDLKTEHDLALELNILGWKKKMLFGAVNKSNSSKKEKPVGRKRETPPLSLQRLKRLLGSFKVTECCVRVDFRDMPLNGILYPVFAWLSWYSGKDIGISFTGESLVILKIKNNLARLSWAWFGSGK